MGILVFEQSNGMGPAILDFTRANQNHDHNTRYATSNFYARYSRTSRYGLNSLSSEGRRLWITIPDVIKQKTSKISFKISYKKFLISNYLH